MPIHTELCEFTTADAETLHGLFFRPQQEERAPDWALLMVHGVGMNFYIPPLPNVGQLLAERGVHAFAMNNRGHDWISWNSSMTGLGGAVYENFEDCLLDIDGGLQFLSSRGYRRFVLVGHSLGAVKSLFYQGTRERSDVIGVISCSAPRQFYSARAIEQPDFPERMEHAQKLVAEGRGEELLWAPASGASGLFSARTYVSKYGPHERNDGRPHAAQLTCPLLVTVGGAENAFFHQYAHELADAGGPDRATLRIIEGAEHFHRDRLPVLAETFAEWLGKAVGVEVGG